MAEITKRDRQKIMKAVERLTNSFGRILKAKNYKAAMEQAAKTIKVLCDLYESLTVVVLDKEAIKRIENAVLPTHKRPFQRHEEKEYMRLVGYILNAPR